MLRVSECRVSRFVAIAGGKDWGLVEAIFSKDFGSIVFITIGYGYRIEAEIGLALAEALPGCSRANWENGYLGEDRPDELVRRAAAWATAPRQETDPLWSLVTAPQALI